MEGTREIESLSRGVTTRWLHQLLRALKLVHRVGFAPTVILLCKRRGFVSLPTSVWCNPIDCTTVFLRGVVNWSLRLGIAPSTTSLRERYSSILNYSGIKLYLGNKRIQERHQPLLRNRTARSICKKYLFSTPLNKLEPLVGVKPTHAKVQAWCTVIMLQWHGAQGWNQTIVAPLPRESSITELQRQ